MRSFAVLALIAAVGVPFADRGHAPQRIILPDAELAGLVGGAAGVASVNVSLPQNFATATPPGTPGVAWNKAGNRCQFDATNFGPSYVGYQTNATNIAVLNGLGLPAPNLEVFGDGRLVSRTTGTYNSGLSNSTFSIYSASLATKCVGGSRNGQMCFGNAFCPGGACRTCDQGFLGCNTANNAVDGPCVTACDGGANINKPCTVPADCPGSFCGKYWYGSACFAKSQCGDPFNFCNYCDCRDNGAGATAGATGHDKFFHSVLSRVIVSPYELSRSENVYAIVQATDVWDPLTQCSALCNGGPDYCVILSGTTYCAKDCG